MNPWLDRLGWREGESVCEDGSTRRYVRAHKDGKTAIFMDCAGPPTPGHALADFVRIGGWLRDIGLRAPEIYEYDAAQGYALVEDFGDVSLKKALGQGEDPARLYGRAAEILNHLGKQSCPLSLPDYHESHVHQGHRRVIDWYLPAVKKRRNPDGALQVYQAAWKDIEQSLPPCPRGFLHIDYHAENLMVLPGGTIGILDFQGAMHGPLPYDLANLLEDARLDVPADIRAAILQAHDESFRLWYRVLGTQFHCRVIGQFIKLALRQGKTHYLDNLPRLQRYIRDALADPVLRPLRQYFSEIDLDFEAKNDLNVAEIADFIQDDAF